MPQPVYRHFTEWQSELCQVDWLAAAVAHQQGWSIGTHSEAKDFVTREQYLAAVEQAKNHSPGQEMRPTSEIAPAPTQDEAERRTWDKERRLEAIRREYRAQWGDKAHALHELVALWKETKDATILLFRIPCHRLKCRGREPNGCDSCWAMGRIADLLAEHYEAQQITGELLRQRVHSEVGQGSMLAWLILRQVRKHRHDKLCPPWDWERAYRDHTAELWLEITKAVGNEPCVDNYRVARVDRRKHVKRYHTQQAKGCCGSHDDKVTIGGVQYLIGFNYGH